MSDPTERLMPEVPAAARLLGLSGLIPFAGLALLIWIAPGEPMPIRLAAGYGAVILSFMGGCRWGFAAAGLGKGPTYRLLALSVAPSLYAWIALELPGPFAFFALALGFILLLSADLSLSRQGGAPAWWPQLRWPLSIGAAASMAVAGVGVA